jgi:hypothetical protein
MLLFDSQRYLIIQKRRVVKGRLMPCWNSDIRKWVRTSSVKSREVWKGHSRVVSVNFSAGDYRVIF